MTYKSGSRWLQRVGGVILMLISLGFWTWGWYTAYFEGYYHYKASMLFPATFILGLGLMLFPGYREERIARGEDISGKSGLKLLTARWWVILTLAFISGVGNHILLSSFS